MSKKNYVPVPYMFLRKPYEPGTYHAVLKKFLQKKEDDISDRTLARLYYNLHPIGRAADNPPIQGITRQWLKKYLDACWLKYAPETVRTIIGDARGFFRWAKKKGYIPKNIARNIKPVRVRSHRHRRAKAAPEADVQQLMEYLVTKLGTAVYRDLFGNLQPAPAGWNHERLKILRDLLILVFLYETGARSGELSGLGTIAMNTSLEQPGPAYVITLSGKTNDRDYYFTHHTAELWRVWEQVRPNEAQEYAVIGWGRGHKPGPLLPNGISHMLVRRCKEAGIRPFRSHSLRHAKVQRTRRLINLEMASKLVDHSSLAVTRRYDNIEHDELREAAVLTGIQVDFFVRTNKPLR